MYQYTATIKATDEVMAKGHNLSEIEKEIIRFTRAKKQVGFKGVIVVHHLQRNQQTGNFKKKLIKEVVI